MRESPRHAWTLFVCSTAQLYSRDIRRETHSLFSFRSPSPSLVHVLMSLLSFPSAAVLSATGTILEATETVLGFPPDEMLMTSAYHTMHDLDLPGFLFIKTHFWDKGDPNVEVYIRRRNVEGDLVWLASKALDYVTHPIPGIIIVESRVQPGEEERIASSLNRITRITAILVQAVEAAKLAKAKSCIV